MSRWVPMDHMLVDSVTKCKPSELLTSDLRAMVYEHNDDTTIKDLKRAREKARTDLRGGKEESARRTQSAGTYYQ